MSNTASWVQNNLEIVKSSQPFIANVIEEFSFPHEFTTEVDEEQNFTANQFYSGKLVRSVSVSFKHDPAIQDRLAQLERLQDVQGEGVILECVYHPGELRALHSLTAKKVNGIVIIVRDFLRFFGVLSLQDFSPLLKLHWLLIVTDQTDPQRLYKEFRSRGLSGYKTWTAVKSTENNASPLTVEKITHYFQKIAARSDKEKDELSSRGSITPSKSPKRVLIVDCWQGCPGSLHLKAMDKALQKHGIRTSYVETYRHGLVGIYSKDTVNLYREWLVPILHSFQPDWVLSIQHHSHEFLTEEFYNEINVPWITYLSTIYPNKPPFGPNEALFLAEGSVEGQLRSLGASYTSFLPLAADYFDEFAPDWSTQDIPISFVGHCFYPKESDRDKARKMLEDYPDLYDQIVAYCEHHENTTKPVSLHEIKQQPFLQVLPPSILKKAGDFINYWIGGGRRLKLVSELFEYGLWLFGSGWKEILPPEILEKHYFGLIVDTSVERQVFRRSKINLNMMWSGNVMGPNMRFFNVPAVGGFQLSNRGPQFPEYFSPGKEIALYQDAESLVQQTEYYLQNPMERMEIATQARIRVRDSHLYEHRVEEMLKKLKDWF